MDKPYIALSISGKTKPAIVTAHKKGMTERTTIDVETNGLIDIPKVLAITIEICKRHGIRKIVFDPWQSSIYDSLLHAGLEVIPERNMRPASANG